MQFASDVIRDGMGLELITAEGDVLAEVFRADADHTVTLNIFDPSTPGSELRRLVETATRELGPFEDGATLASAKNYGALIACLGSDA
jgi:hypothetical protein